MQFSSCNNIVGTILCMLNKIFQRDDKPPNGQVQHYSNCENPDFPDYKPQLKKYTAGEIGTHQVDQMDLVHHP